MKIEFQRRKQELLRASCHQGDVLGRISALEAETAALKALPQYQASEAEYMRLRQEQADQETRAEQLTTEARLTGQQIVKVAFDDHTYRDRTILSSTVTTLTLSNGVTIEGQACDDCDGSLNIDESAVQDEAAGHNTPDANLSTPSGR